MDAATRSHVQARDYVVPRFIGLAPQDVVAIARAEGFAEVEVPPNAIYVRSQGPAPGTQRTDSDPDPAPLRLKWAAR